MFSDPWLDRWLPLIKERAGTRPVLEIGCGQGDDTVTLAKAGLPVIGFDLSRTAVAVTRVRVPAAQIERRDAREPLPDAAKDLGVVLASLSLHYFPWDETTRIVARIQDALRPHGILVCRLNSTEDRHFGADGHEEIEPGLFSVDGQPKRFFDEAASRKLFGPGWSILSIEHTVTDKYFKPKAAWELVVEKG